MDLTQLFCDVDDFVKKYKINSANKIDEGKKTRNYFRACKLSESEVMTICIYYHISGYKNFKCYYTDYISNNFKSHFPNLVSYNRFLEMISTNLELLVAYLISKFGANTRISYIDSTPIQVCKPKRMNRNKVFDGIAEKSRSTIGWFFGFKLHIII